MKGYLNRFLLLVIVILGVIPGSVSAQDNELYSFDAVSFAKKTWEWKGDITATGTTKGFNADSVLYPVKFPDEDQGQASEINLQLSLESRWDWECSRLFIAVDANLQRSELEDADYENSLLREGYWQFSELDPHTVEIGKRLLRWGKGYAFNPVAFLERQKNPEDPEASREGLWVIQGLWIPGSFSFFDNSSLNLVYLPVRNDLNDDYATTSAEGDEWGLKLYTLIGTADFDLYFVQKQDRDETDWGIDFSANITSNLEIHGEYASLDSEESAHQILLLGTRYLTENDVTWIMEGYHDSSGLTKEESMSLFKSASSGSIADAKKLMSLTQQSKTLNQNYAYLKASVKEPFDWLYLTPAVAWLINMDDSSTNMNLQLTYTPGNNWVFLSSWQHLAGDPATQFGENIVRDMIVMEGTYSF
ncbi:MAG: hypothetical protein HQ517_01280 [SAR324 cluster bacterium]|nr:hypothetical protein [SAR324 cluster bacterium]